MRSFAGVLLTLSVLAHSAVARAQVSPWNSGTYAYDGAGNISGIGSDYYVYDPAGRLIRGSADKQRSGVDNYQSYTYDKFGNRLTVTTTGTACIGGCGVNLDINELNHIKTTSHGASYDGGGNLKQFDGFQYNYDAAQMMSRMRLPNTVIDSQYIYTADEERLATFTAPGQWRFTVRDVEGKVLREVTASEGFPTLWSWNRDHVFRDGLLLATVMPSAVTQHYHLDHLGTPKLVTGNGGVKLGVHAYYPFGDELSLGLGEVATQRLKFTGHERDENGTYGNSLDYMHARHYNPGMGRLLSVDPTWASADIGRPQSWNRYAYVMNNPINLTDPTGKVWHLVGDTSAIRKLQAVANAGLFGQQLTVTNGTAALASNGMQGPQTQEQQALADTLSGVIDDSATTTTAVVSDHPSFFIAKSINRDGTVASPQTMDAGDMARIGPGPGTTGAAILGHEVREQYLMQTQGAGYNAAHAAGIGSENLIAGSTRLDSNASVARSGNAITFEVRYQQNGCVIPFRIEASLTNGLITNVEPRPLLSKLAEVASARSRD
ncbi:MAG: RHS repeat-associated core domain-containing protein [Acidobacteriota bacterium]